MIFTWERESATGACALAAAPEDYDGYPKHATFVTDMVPRSVSPDRLAVAFILAFRPYISGAVRFPYSVHPETAEAIRNYLTPTAVFFSEINFEPENIPHGSGAFVLNPEGDYAVDRTWSGFENLRITELRLEHMNASFSHYFRDDLLIVPTNAASIVSEEPDPELRLLPYLASAVLLSEDFDIGIIRLPVSKPTQRPLTGASALLRSAGLVLQFEG